MKYVIAIIVVMAVVIALIAICAPEQEPAPAQQGGISVDIDRSKPRKKMDAPKSAPKARSH